MTLVYNSLLKGCIWPEGDIARLRLSRGIKPQAPRDRLPVPAGWRFGEAGRKPLKVYGLGWDKRANCKVASPSHGQAAARLAA